MKVTVCFGDTKIIVPCNINSSSPASGCHSIPGSNTFSLNNEYLLLSQSYTKVSEVIENAISRYKKATSKPINCIVNVHKLQTLRDGGILDPDDYIQDLVEDKEILVAIYEEYNSDDLKLSTSFTKNNRKKSKSSHNTCHTNQHHQLLNQNFNTYNKNVPNSLDNSSISTSSTSSTNDTSSLSGPLGHPSFGQINNLNCTNMITSFYNHKTSTLNTNTLNSIIKNQVVVTENDLLNAGNNNVLKVKNANETTFSNNNNVNVTSSLTKSTTETKSNKQEDTNALMTKSATFSRMSTKRQSVVQNENGLWSTGPNDNVSSWQSIKNQQEKMYEFQLSDANSSTCPLGIHVIPSYDVSIQKDLGLVIQRIETNGRIFKDGRFRIEDRIIEINSVSLIGVDFIRAQGILRDILARQQQQNSELRFKIVRVENEQLSRIAEPTENGTNEREIEEDSFYNDNIEESLTEIDNTEENEEEKTRDSNHDNPIENPSMVASYSSNGLSTTNLNALNTRKIGTKVVIELQKGPQGLGFNLAARDNCSYGKYSPIYIKSILPMGSAILDGRLQRGDRLLEVNKIDVTQMTLNEVVNLLRNIPSGSIVEICVSRQVADNLVSQTDLITSTEYANDEGESIIPEKIQTEELEQEIKIETEIPLTSRQIYSFTINLIDPDSVEGANTGLGITVKGKSKRLEDGSVTNLGIYIRSIINGGAAHRDGRLRSNDQLLIVNGHNLKGKSNDEAMNILKETLQNEIDKVPQIEITISRDTTENDKNDTNQTRFIQKRGFSLSPQKKMATLTRSDRVSSYMNQNDAQRSGIFDRDAPTRRSMSEKRTKIGNVNNYIKDRQRDRRKIGSSSMAQSTYTLPRNYESNNLVMQSFDNVPTGNDMKPTQSHHSSQQIILNNGSKTLSHRQSIRPLIDRFEQKQQQLLTNNDINNLLPYDTVNKTENNQETTQNNNQTNVSNRKSISMDSIPSNMHNDIREKKQQIIEKLNNNNNNAGIQLKENQIIIPNFTKNPNLNASKIMTRAKNLLLHANENLTDNQLNNRLRAINKSFRTAVDKSFSVSNENTDTQTGPLPNNSNLTSSTSVPFALIDIDQISDKPSHKEPVISKSKNNEVKSKKGLIGTFQNFFKTNSIRSHQSSNNKNLTKSESIRSTNSSGSCSSSSVSSSNHSIGSSQSNNTNQLITDGNLKPNQTDVKISPYKLNQKDQEKFDTNNRINQHIIHITNCLGHGYLAIV